MFALGTGSLTAELIYDTQTQHLPRGVRTLIERERRLLFAAAEYEVVLEVVSDGPGGWSCITGQVLAEGVPVPDAAIILDEGTAQRTDDNGSFRLVRVSTARCTLRVEAPTLELALPSFDLTCLTEGPA
jgi:hypothetical protein